MRLAFAKFVQDRRGAQRGAHDRRRSQRWLSDRPLRFRCESDTSVCEGKVIARSLDGLVVLVESKDIAPSIRRIVAVESPQQPAAGFRTAIVCRQEITRDGLVLYAEVES